MLEVLKTKFCALPTCGDVTCLLGLMRLPSAYHPRQRASTVTVADRRRTHNSCVCFFFVWCLVCVFVRMCVRFVWVLVFVCLCSCAEGFNKEYCSYAVDGMSCNAIASLTTLSRVSSLRIVWFFCPHLFCRAPQISCAGLIYCSPLSIFVISAVILLFLNRFILNACRRISKERLAASFKPWGRRRPPTYVASDIRIGHI